VLPDTTTTAWLTSDETFTTPVDIIIAIPSESTDAGEKNKGSNSKGNFIIPGIIGVCIVIVLIVIVIIVAVGKHRKSADVLALGPRRAVEGPAFENALFNPRLRDVSFDNPRYSLLHVQTQ
jgi:hypothetical protein